MPIPTTKTAMGTQSNPRYTGPATQPQRGEDGPTSERQWQGRDPPGCSIVATGIPVPTGPTLPSAALS